MESMYKTFVNLLISSLWYSNHVYSDRTHALLSIYATSIYRAHLGMKVY